jgi:hypothetical protein
MVHRITRVRFTCFARLMASPSLVRSSVSQNPKTVKRSIIVVLMCESTLTSYYYINRHDFRFPVFMAQAMNYSCWGNFDLIAMEQYHDATTLTPKSIVDAFQRAYHQVYGRDAQVVHMFAEWYQVNGETVHRLTLFGEISRLRGLAQHQQQQHKSSTDKSVIQRLIARLRGA